MFNSFPIHVRTITNYSVDKVLSRVPDEPNISGCQYTPRACDHLQFQFQKCWNIMWMVLIQYIPPHSESKRFLNVVIYMCFMFKCSPPWNQWRSAGWPIVAWSNFEEIKDRLSYKKIVLYLKIRLRFWYYKKTSLDAIVFSLNILVFNTCTINSKHGIV